MSSLSLLSHAHMHPQGSKRLRYRSAPWRRWFAHITATFANALLPTGMMLAGCCPSTSLRLFRLLPGRCLSIVLSRSSAYLCCLLILSVCVVSSCWIEYAFTIYRVIYVHNELLLQTPMMWKLLPVGLYPLCMTYAYGFASQSHNYVCTV